MQYDVLEIQVLSVLPADNKMVDIGSQKVETFG